MNKLKKELICLILVSFVGNTFIRNAILAQSAMINVQGRHTTSLNGKWQAIIDPTDGGDWRQVWKEPKAVKKTDFFEYSFDGGPQLNVPGDFNTQMTELTYLEGTVWYKTTFKSVIKPGKRLFLHFGAVNYMATIYLNGNKIGSHEGGFTPFQVEITNLIHPGENALVVKTTNQRVKDGIPGLDYDWFNYGGITRDVNLIETNEVYIDDYLIQLKKHSFNEVEGWVQLSGNNLNQQVRVVIPELGINFKTKTNNNGLAKVRFRADIKLWSPSTPKLYNVSIQSQSDSVSEQIGFRCIETKGPKILLNGKPVFLKGVNIHEENPIKAAKAYSDPDAFMLLSWAKELGCNMVRLAHYPHNEHMVKMAEKMGIMVWDEIPVYQNIEFAAPGVPAKMSLMLREMIKRDRNRCNVVIWSLANETSASTPNRNKALIDLSNECRQLDSTRLITTVTCNQGYDHNTFNVWDPIYNYFDIISVNEYIGWYVPWQGRPEDTKWKLIYNDKPVILSEFGGEALYGSNTGPKDEANSWSEEYQEQIYKDQTKMFTNVPNLAGLCPWILTDFRSLSRMQPVYQKGWNRKGLISNGGEKKKAWYVMKKYYDSIK
jgi:beta-glucuronidase